MERESIMPKANVKIVRAPMAEVELLTATALPARTIGTVSRVFKGTDDFEMSTDSEEVEYFLDQINKTELQGPLEFVSFVFSFKNVTRAFTHQLVRYRLGTSFVQESLRFTNKSNAMVLATAEVCASQKNLNTYCRGVVAAVTAYQKLVDSGVPIQDARGLLPIHILTNIWASLSLRTLINIWGHRMCYQAQEGEWQLVLGQVKALLQKSHPQLIRFLVLPCDKGLPCPFASKLDRPCPIHPEAQRR